MPQHLDYGSIFDRRGAAYHRAMTTLPAVRAEEFRALVAKSELLSGSVVLDVPSGGGYLAAHLPDGVTCLHVETSSVFHSAARRVGRAAVLTSQMGQLPIASGSVDRVLSLAGLHHEVDRLPFYREAARVLRPGGRLLIAEVPKDSPVAEFLEGFVDQHGDGHRGHYLCPNERVPLEEAGFTVESIEVVATPWRASSALELGWFCRELFATERATPEEVFRELERVIGVRRSADDSVELAWELTFYSCAASAC